MAGKVVPVDGDYEIGAQLLGKHDNGGIGASQRKIGVLLNKLGDARPIVAEGRDDVNIR